MEKIRSFVIFAGLALLFSSCATISNALLPAEDANGLNKSVKQLIQEKQFADAKSFLANHEGKTEHWCYKYDRDGKCLSRTDKSPIPWLKAAIERAEKCDEALALAKSPLTTQDQARDTANSLRRLCDAGAGFPHNAQGLAVEIEGRVPGLAPPPFEAAANGYLAVKFAQAQDRCRSGMKWFFQKLKTPDQMDRQVVFMGERSFAGPFERKDQCEEARLNTPRELRSGWSINDLCEQKYRGETVTAEVVQASYMTERARETPGRDTLTFSSEEFCQEAATSLYDVRGTTIHPLGSQEPTRFIEKCQRKRVEVCRKGQNGPEISSMDFTK